MEACGITCHGGRQACGTTTALGQPATWDNLRDNLAWGGHGTTWDNLRDNRAVPYSDPKKARAFP